MCGRATLVTSIDEIAEELGVAPEPIGPPRYNVAPGQTVVVVRLHTEEREEDAAPARELSLLRWGLLPFGSAKKPFVQARAETVETARPFRDAFASRRCLVVVDGFYEWSSPSEGKRQPHHVHRPDGRILALAGLWERCRTKDGEWLETCAVVTTRAEGAVRAIHERMPLVIAPADRDAWLGGSSDEAHALLGRGQHDLVLTPVSMRVNDVKNDDPGCLAPAAADPTAGDVKGQIALQFR